MRTIEKIADRINDATVVSEGRLVHDQACRRVRGRLRHRLDGRFLRMAL